MTNCITLRRVFGDQHRGRAGHINIQHYAQLIEDARRKWLSQRNLTLNALKLQFEKVRFSSELHSGDEAAISSQFFITEYGRIGCATEINRTSDGMVVTRCQQIFSADRPLTGLGNQSIELGLREILLDQKNGHQFDSYAGTVPADIAGTGDSLSARGLWYLITEALWSVQNQIGASTEYLSAKGIAGGASMFQLEHHGQLAAGATVRMTTTAIGTSASSLRYQHDILNADKDKLKEPQQPLITARYVLTYFDRESGERCPVPSKTIDQLWD